MAAPWLDVVWIAEHAAELAVIRGEASETRAALSELFQATQSDDPDWIAATIDKALGHVALMAQLLLDAPSRGEG